MVELRAIAITLLAVSCGGESVKPAAVPKMPGAVSTALPAGPRVAPELAPLLAWVPNDTSSLMLLTPKATAVAIDRFIEPLLSEMPDAISSMIAGVGSVRPAFEVVAGTLDGPIFVRAEPGGAFARKDVIGRLHNGAKVVGPEDMTRSNGFNVTAATRLNVESWSTVTIDANLVALVPFESVESFTKLLAVHAVGDPIALRGLRVQAEHDLIAMVWYAPGPADHDARPLTLATTRVTARGEGGVALTMMLEPKDEEDAARIVTSLEALKVLAPKPVAASYRASTISTETVAGKKRVIIDVAF